eukprot:CAMPEP_0202014352 /NCGR_PEP_ID=MMETSP0905-20130828/28825_1 /ASSEMBLY_ACC=CAM_ASM_000554 /TAXON_ID=420261 /ORGANISM="Thalassiosira antarctica, Strain CCMP982" /LENGTH=568 /DNA_ID=CAMNT_0048574227 /DNA_START=57 /DNA_END=1760 /DNA_ORIENTATION=-
MLSCLPKTLALVAITTVLLLQINGISCFSSPSSLHHHASTAQQNGGWHRPTTQLLALSPEEENELKQVQEESRLKVLTDRRKTIRGILKAAEGSKNYRLENDYVPELDPETGKPLKSDSQSALTLTAFVVAGGAVLLRFGGRAALVSAVGLDFATENPQLKDGLDQVLNYASTIGTESELALFVLAWTAVKVLCVDAGGVVLALASGILFGGVWQGAVVSAFGATVGSSVAFALAKLDTPVRKKALEVVEEYPSLRGIEKVVAKDGLKAILTLRLAPVLPIPIGLYNYVYGVTNVPYPQFAGGIFLGSLKPYLLDSYIGIFGKQLVDGTAAEGGFQDALLLIALGVSVLIGVFASQLANETWEYINEEVEIEKAQKAALEGEDEKDDVMREFMGMELPQFIVGFQLALQAADERVNTMIEEEYHAQVWNYTMEELEASNDVIDPATQPSSPEVVQMNTGFDFGATICSGLVLSPALLGAYLRYADPLYVEDDDSKQKAMKISAMDESGVVEVVSNYSEKIEVSPGNSLDVEISVVSAPKKQQTVTYDATVADLISALSLLRAQLQKEL